MLKLGNGPSEVILLYCHSLFKCPVTESIKEKTVEAKKVLLALVIFQALYWFLKSL